jgi:hypothetical protein
LKKILIKQMLTLSHACNAGLLEGAAPMTSLGIVGRPSVLPIKKREKPA